MPLEGRDHSIGTSPSCTPDEILTVVQGDAVADLDDITTDLTGVDTGTDMTAAQAALIEDDLGAVFAKVNDLLAELRAAKVIASS